VSANQTTYAESRAYSMLPFFVSIDHDLIHLLCCHVKSRRQNTNVIWRGEKKEKKNPFWFFFVLVFLLSSLSVTSSITDSYIYTSLAPLNIPRQPFFQLTMYVYVALWTSIDESMKDGGGTERFPTIADLCNFTTNRPQRHNWIAFWMVIG
jgi:hypothetical protein